MNKTNMIAVLLLFAVAGVAMADATEYDSSVILENKYANWTVADHDKFSVTVDYNARSDVFEYHVYGKVACPLTCYSLIYYADQDDRFDDWGGNSPGAWVVDISTAACGEFDEVGTIELDMNMPYKWDWNIAPDPWDEYCNESGDDYDHCCGAKLWMVPCYALPNPYPGDGVWQVEFWDLLCQPYIMFETDLIWYDDTDENEVPNIEDVDISSECFAAGVSIDIIVEVYDLDGAYDMDNMIVTANFTGNDVNELVTLDVVECDNDCNCTTRDYIGNVTIDVADVNVTCEVVATDPSGECANYTYKFQMMDTIAPIVIEGGYPGNFMVGNVNTGKHDFTATCYTVCNITEECGNVSWSCSNKYVATIDVSTGELVARHAGVAVVTATSDNVSDMVDIIVDAKPSWFDMTGFNVAGVANATSRYTTLVVDLGTGTGSGYVQEIGDPASEPISGAVCGNIGDIVVKGAHVFALAHDNGNTSNYTYTLTMCYDADNVVGLGIDVNTLTVLTCNGTSWVEVDGVDNEDGCVTVDISGNGTYALVGTAPVEDEDDITPVDNNRGSSRSGTYPPDDDSDDDSDVVDDVIAIPDEPDVVLPPADIPDMVETPTTENTIDADIEHPDDDDGVNILWLFAGAVAVIAIGCAVVIKWRT